MGRDGNADAVREFDHALLLQVGQAHVALDQIVLENFRALQFHLELRGTGNGDAHLVINAAPLHQIAGGENARADAHAGVVGFAVFDAFIRRVAGTAHGSDAEREPGAVFRFAEILLQVRVDIR